MFAMLKQLMATGGCRVNGTAMQPGSFEMHAVFAPVTATDCVLQTPNCAELVVGTTSSFQLKIADAEKLARCFEGTEHVTAYVSGASQITLVDPCDSVTWDCLNQLQSLSLTAFIVYSQLHESSICTPS